MHGDGMRRDRWDAYSEFSRNSRIYISKWTIVRNLGLGHDSVFISSSSSSSAVDSMNTPFKNNNIALRYVAVAERL